MQKQPMVSVLIPTYNQEKYISQTIESVISQKRTFDIEILVGDDCSKDRTTDIVIDFQSKYPGIVRGFFAKSNQGLVRNVYSLLNNAKGKYFALLGGDDFFSNPDKLDKQVSFLEAHPDYGVVHSDADFLFHDEIEEKRVIKCMHLFKKQTIPEGNVYEEFLVNNSIFACTACFRSDLYHKFVNFNEFINHGFLMEDLPIWLELSRRTKFKYIPESLATYRVIKNTVSRPKDYAKQYRFWNNFFSVSKYFAGKHGCSVETKEKMLYKISEFNLMYAFLLRDKLLATEAYAYLSGLRNYSSRKMAKLYYIGSQNILTWVIVKIYLKLFGISVQLESKGKQN